MQASAAFLTRVSVLAKALASLNVASVRVDYAGSNDEGYVDEVVYLDAQGNKLDVDVEAPVSLWKPDEEADRQDLDDALEELAFDVVYLAGLERFDEDPAGGKGAMTLTCEGKVALNHGSNEIVTHYKTYALQGDQVAAVA